MIKMLLWDSEFFGLKIGELSYNGNVGDLDHGRFELLYIISNEDHELKLGGFTCSFAEEKIKFQKFLLSASPKLSNVLSYRDTQYAIDDIYQLAYESGKYSRFSGDKNFSSGKFEELYRQWIVNSISTNFADDVLLYKDEEKAIGLLTYSIKDNIATVGLLAVSPEHQGKGIGKILLQHLEAVLYENGISALMIPTQNINEAACKFYTKNGYLITERHFIKHYWKIYDPI